MEIKREALDGPSISGGAPLPFGAQAPEDFRSRQLMARDLLRGDLEGDALDYYVEQAVMTTTLDKAVAWAQGNSSIR